MSLTVVTVLRSGGEYTSAWVHRLRRQVSEHLDAPHDFVCLSDQPVDDVETTPLKHDWPGYWSKLELYRPGLFSGRVLYLDLDMLIVDDITPLAGYGGPFLAVRDHYSPEIQSSSVLAFDGYDPPKLYHLALQESPRMRRNARSDLFWNQHYRADALQDLYPGMIGSYKADGLQDGPGDFHIIDFHGHPTPADLEGEWPYRVWRVHGTD